MHVGLATGFAHQRGDAYPDRQFIREELHNLVLAEELGLDSVWITEHHFSDYSMCPDPLMLLAHVASRTKRIRLGTQVIVVPWHDPVRLAEQIILLDHVSDGRALLGFGRGLARAEYEGFRVDQAQAREIYDEMLTLVVPAIETGVIEGGEIFKLPRRELRPRPLKSFAGRMFTGGSTEGSMQIAAKLGIGRLILMLPQGNPTTKSDPFAEAWAAVNGPGSKPVPPFVSGMVCVDESAERAMEVGRRHVAHTMRAAVDHYEMAAEHFGTVKGYESYVRLRVPPDGIDDMVETYANTVIAGTPKQVLERLHFLKDYYDPQGFFPQLYFGGMPQDEAVRNMRYFAQTCLPEMKGWDAPSTIDVLSRVAA